MNVKMKQNLPLRWKGIAEAILDFRMRIWDGNLGFRTLFSRSTSAFDLSFLELEGISNDVNGISLSQKS